MFGKLLGAIIGFYLTRSSIGAIVGALAGHFFLDVKSKERSTHNSSKNGQSGGQSSGFSGSPFSRFRGFSFGSAAMFQRQDLFFELFFGLLGKLAKIDGKFSTEEEHYMNSLLDKMNISGSARGIALQHFHNAFNDVMPYTQIAQQFYQSTLQQPQLSRQLLYQLVGLASSDNVITKEERTFLQEISKIFHLSETELDHMLKSFDVKDDNAYHVLGVTHNANNEEIRKAYKELIREYHPDTLQSKGLHPSMLAFAEKRFLDIQNAWATIKKERKIE